MLEFLKRKDKRTELEKEIDDEIEYLRSIACDVEDYEQKYDDELTRLERLKKLKDEKKSISPDTLLVVLANLLGIALILGYEKAGVVTSKAMNFVLRGRV